MYSFRSVNIATCAANSKERCVFVVCCVFMCFSIAPLTFPTHLEQVSRSSSIGQLSTVIHTRTMRAIMIASTTRKPHCMHIPYARYELHHAAPRTRSLIFISSHCTHRGSPLPLLSRRASDRVRVYTASWPAAAAAAAAITAQRGKAFFRAKSSKNS